MLRHLSFQSSGSIRTAATLLLFASAPGFQAQTTSSSLAEASAADGNCSDLRSTPCPPTPPPPGTPVHHGVETSISLGAFAQITPTRLQNNKYDGLLLSTQTQGIAPTAGVLGTFRQQFRPWLGYSVNMGYTRVDERYLLPSYPAYNSDLHVPSNLYELSFSYVATERLTPRLTGFADLGAGFLTALPTHRSVTPSGELPRSANFRPESVTGFGLDFQLANNLDFRAEYRGLLYKNPDFGGLQKSTTWTSEPTLSLVYRFGGPHPVAKPRLGGKQ